MYSRSQLHEYQVKSVNFILAKERCALWLGLGLGKTIITLTAIKDWIDSFASGKTLVIAPLRVAKNVWIQEAAQWEHTKDLKFSLVVGTEVQRLSALRKKADVYIINRENIVWLVQTFWTKWPYDTVIVDESSSFKSNRTKRFKALRNVLGQIDKIVLLTGTPASNGLLDLWAQIFLIDRGKALGRTITSFKSRFFKADYMGWSWEATEEGEKEIHQKLTPMVLSMKSEDYVSVPDLINVNVQIDLSPELMTQYSDFKAKSVLELAGEDIEAVNAGALAGKLLQFCNGAVYGNRLPGETGVSWREIHNRKLDVLEEILEDNTAENVIVTYKFKSDLERLKKRFPQASTIDRPNCVDLWNAGKIKMLLLHPASAGHGLNLQKGGSTIVFFSLEWSLELYLQVIGRLHRQGQTRPVRVIHLVCSGCFDERVIEILSSKQTTQDSLISALKKEMF